MKKQARTFLIATTAALSFAATWVQGQPYTERSNYYEVNDALDPNDPDELVSDTTDPPFFIGYSLNMGASGPTVTNPTQAWILTLTSFDGGGLRIYNSTKSDNSPGEFHFPLLITPGAGNTASGNSLVVLADEAVGIGCHPWAPLHICDTQWSGLAEDVQNPALILDSGASIWQMNHYADYADGGGALSFYYDDFTTQDFGDAPVYFVPAPEATLVVGIGRDEPPRVGIGDQVWGPEATLHVRDEDGTRLLVENTNAAAAGDQLLFWLKIPGNQKARFAITANATNTWTFDNNPVLDSFSISKAGTGKNEFLVKSNGDGTFRGNSYAVNHFNTSSRTTKTDFSEIDAQDILLRLAALPISEWRYKKAGASERHIGPVAEDFKEVFSLGDGKTISTVDASGVAFAAIKGLKQEKDRQLERLNAENEGLRNELRKQAYRLAQLEMALLELQRDQSSAVQVGLAY